MAVATVTARLAVILILGQVAAVSQEPAEFEVASIHLAPSSPGIPSPSSFRRDAARIAYSARLSELVLRAYDIPNYRVAWPDRLSEQRQTRYDISAVLPAGPAPTQLGPMLQRLLSDRLGLATHWEKQNLPCYVLTVAPSGLKMQKSKYVESASAADPSEEPQPGNRFSIFRGPAEERITGIMSLAQLSGTLGAQIGKPMLDRTGVEGYFDIDFAWSNPLERVSPFGSNPGGSASTPAASHAAAVLPALEKELGLKAELRKEATDVLVVDRVNAKPTPN